MIVHQPVLTAVNINGRMESMLDVYRVDSQLSTITTATNNLIDEQQALDKLNSLLVAETREFRDFMEFYFSTMPDMRRAFNEWKVAQQTKERILDGHSND